LSLAFVGAVSASTRTAADADKLPQLDKTGVVVPWEDFKKILDSYFRMNCASLANPCTRLSP
ncbi:MAG: hypothetical protein LN417_04265, partial [Candidatus Thermoplasmatota archaeon]|nr:hypothetical protein [Candidatus Thermoplasmatota archaeon]